MNKGKLQYIVIIIICLIVSLFSEEMAAVSTESANKNNSAIRTYQQGELRYVNGIPCLELVGSHYDMGLQYGALMKEELKESLDLLYNYFEKVLKDEPVYIRIFANAYMQMNSEFMERRIPELYREELKGMAYGSGISYDKLLLAAMLPEITGTGCTTILSRIDGRMVLARNLDYHPHFFGEKPVIIKYSPEKGHSFVSISIIGFPGVLTGVNEKGLALSLNQIELLQSQKSRAIPVGYKNREILETCSTLQEVDNCLQGFRPDMGWLITAASRVDNEGYIYNISSNEVKKNVTGKAEYNFATNYYLIEEMNKNYLGFLDVTSFYNMGRYKGVKEQLENGINTIDEIIGLLGSTYYAGYNDPEFGLMHYCINNEGSIQSIVIDCRGDIYFASNPGYSGSAPFFRYDIESGSLTKYREGNRELLEWAEKSNEIWNKIVFTPHEEDLELVDFIISSIDDITIYEVRQLVKIRRKGKNVIPDDIYRKIIHGTGNKFSRLPIPQIWKAKLLLEQGKEQKAIESLKSVLELKALLPSSKMEAYRLLANIYQDSNGPKARFYAEKTMSIVKQYQIGAEEEKIISEMSKIKGN